MTKALLALALVGCTSGYLPRSPGRVAVTMDNGTLVYVRDGQRYPHGLFGSGLVSAVSGQREAETAANEYHDRLVTGGIATLVGLVCMPIAGGYIAFHAEDDASSNHLGVAAATMLGCAGLTFVGALYAASAAPYQWDAINQFNDSPPPPPWRSSNAIPAGSIRSRLTPEHASLAFPPR